MRANLWGGGCLALAVLFLAAGCATTGTTERIESPADTVPVVAPGNVEAWYEFSLGVQAELAGNYVSAADHLDRALQYDSNAIGIHEELGYLYLQLGKPRDAITHYLPVLAANPGAYQTNLQLGSAYLALARHREALDCFTQAAANPADRADGKAQFYVAVTRTMAGDYAAAATAYEQYLLLAPDDAVGWYNLGVLHDGLGQDSQAINALERTAALEPTSVRALARLALLYRKQERLADATAAISRAVTLEPATASHRLLLAELATEQGDHDAAIRQYREVLRQTPHDIRAQFQLGLAYARLKDYPQAITALQRCIALDPEMITPYIELGYLYQLHGDLEASVTTFRQALTVDPHNASLHELLGLTYEAQHDTAAARAAYAAAIAAAPRNTLNARYHLAGLEYKDGNFAAAEAGYRAVLAQNPNHAPSLNDLAYLYIERQTELPAARELIARALELVPDNACYLDTLGWLEYTERNFAAAVQTLARAAALSNDREIAWHLGEANYQLGRFAAARAAWRELMDDMRVRERLAVLPESGTVAAP